VRAQVTAKPPRHRKDKDEEYSVFSRREEQLVLRSAQEGNRSTAAADETP